MPTQRQLVGLRLRQLEKNCDNYNHSLDVLYRAIDKIAPDVIPQVQKEIADEWNREKGFTAVLEDDEIN